MSNRVQPEVAILDFGSGNVRSLTMALEEVGARVHLVQEAHVDPEQFTHFVIGGVGAFPRGMAGLEDRGLSGLARRLTELRTPGLGICLGMQLLFDASTELGGSNGLGLIPGQVDFILNFVPDRFKESAITPNIGWRKVEFKAPAPNRPASGKFYFVHSFGVSSDNPHVSGLSEFANAPFAAEVSFKNLRGCQFHPEKSGRDGLLYLAQFLEESLIRD